jgi:uncharacterized membrane protein
MEQGDNQNQEDKKRSAASPPPLDNVHSNLPHQVQQPQQFQRQQTGADQTDILGILSLVMIAVFPIAGVILGYIGQKEAKKAGYSDTLSKIGFWINLGLVLLGVAFFAFIFGLSFLVNVNN